MIPDFVEKFMSKKSHAGDSEEEVKAREVAGEAIKEEVFKDSEVKSRNEWLKKENAAERELCSVFLI